MQNTERLKRLIAGMPESEIPGLLDQALSQEQEAEGAELRAMLVRRWAGLAPARAAAWIARWPQGIPRIDAGRQIAIVWSNADLPAALRWAHSLPEGEAKTAAQASIGYEAARSNLQAAFDVAYELPPGQEQTDLLTHCARQWATTDPATAMAWAQTIPEAGLRASVVGRIVAGLAEQDGSAAANVVAAEVNEGNISGDGVIAVVQRWAQNAPEKAARWVDQFPEGTIRSAAIQNLIAQWAQTDAETASAWVQTLPEGSSRETATVAMTFALAPNDPEAALWWSDLIENETTRASLQYQLTHGP